MMPVKILVRLHCGERASRRRMFVLILKGETGNAINYLVGFVDHMSLRLTVIALHAANCMNKRYIARILATNL
jgi:hypothetical protein